MNRNYLLNDTFDNISFNELGNCPHGPQNGNEDFKRPFELAFQKKIYNNGKLIDNGTCKNQNTKVSFDDSQFFSESFCVPSGYTTINSDSEDLFGESDLDWNKDFSSKVDSSCKSSSKFTNTQSEDLFSEAVLLKNSEDIMRDSILDNIESFNMETDMFDSNVLTIKHICTDDVKISPTHIKLEIVQEEDNIESRSSNDFNLNIVNEIKEEIPSDSEMIFIENSSQMFVDPNMDHNYVKSEHKELTQQKAESLQQNEMYSINNNKSIHTLTVEEVEIDVNNLETASGKIIQSCALEDWGLPDAILEKYDSKKVTNMFDWQVECLNCPGVLESNKNLVYSAPTSAGKTLVAEILAIKTVLERKKKVLFILPFVSVVREKMFYFQDILGSSGIRVEGYMGSYNPPGDFKSVQFAICTIEKANSLVNRMLAEGTLSDIGAVIIDEMHLLGDSSRGYLLELMLTKIQYMSKKNEDICIQMVGMSATLPNLDLLAKWLDAELYTTTFRPIPLYELCHFNGEIYSSNLQLQRRILPISELENDTDNVLQLCLETIKDSCSVLIFCPTKSWCENLSQQIAMAFWKLGSSKSDMGKVLRDQLNSDAISELLEQLKRCPVGLDNVLAKTVAFSVAFHHAGLTMDERDIIEGAFRLGTLRVLVATSTLSSGVNLPARRVIIRTPTFNGRPLDTLTYRQMIGRAGRMGKDTAGESILLCQKNDNNTARELMSANLHPVESCLEGSGKLKRAILEVIASEVASSPEDVRLFTSCTLLAADDSDNNEIQTCIDDSINFLSNNEFIRLQKLEDGTYKYVATALAKACLSSSMPPDEGLALFAELEKARQCIVLDTDLHMIYLVTPYSVCYQWNSIDWMQYLKMYEVLSPSMKRVAELVGVRESYLINATRGKLQVNTAKLQQRLLVHKRFYTALALQDLVNEVPLNEVANKFNCSRGMLQSLQQSSSSFAGMVTAFSRQLGWANVEILISQFQDRLQFGVSRDLLDLMRLPILNSVRARALYNAGVETLVQLASADALALENVLHKAKPFESEKEREGEGQYEAQKRKEIKSVWITGMQGITEREAAELMIKDARRFLQIEMGLIDAKWGISENPTSQKVMLQNSQKVIVQNSQKVIMKNSQKSSASERLSKTSQQASQNSLPLAENVANSSKISSQLEVPKRISKSESTPKSKDNVISKSQGDTSSSSASFSLEISPITQRLKATVSKQLELDSQPKEPNSNNSLFEGSSENLFEKSLGEDINNGITSLKLNESNTSVISVSTSIEDVFEKSFDYDSQKQIPNKSKRTRNSINQESLEIPSKKRKCSQDDLDNESFKVSKSEDTNPLDLSKLEIIDVCRNSALFDTFSKEISDKFKISLSIGCLPHAEVKTVIGSRLLNRDVSFEKVNNKYCFQNRKVVGYCICFGGITSYYISLEDETFVKNYHKINLLKNLLKKSFVNVRIFDCKEQLKVLKQCCGIEFNGELEDPKVGDWIMEPEGKEKNLQAMVLHYVPEAVGLGQFAGGCKGVGSTALDLDSNIHPRIRAAVESVLTWYLADAVKDAIMEQDSKLIHCYNTEMNTMIILTKMELDGIGVNTNKLQSLGASLKLQIDSIEKNAYLLAGRKFSLTSSADVAKVIGIYRGKKCSTNKQVLEKNENPISNMVVQWRKANNALTKMIYPLLRVIKNNRIYGTCITHNATGRISMHEPNLQNVPRDFDFENTVTGETSLVSCRSVFIPGGNNVLLSVDYCQLELRLLAHLSQDTTLCSIMRKKGEDVFKSIAAKCNNIPEEEVTDDLRQRAKQICYGIIYGMGARLLADQLGTTECEASIFMNTFHKKYTGIQDYIHKTIATCRELGFVQTLAGRKRYLPHIQSENIHVRKQAERQAVNTTVQGSAADIVKKATILVEHKLTEKYSDIKRRPKLVLQLHDELLYEVPAKQVKIVANILKESLENSVQLSVPFPVKLKSGPSWGELTDFTLA